MEHNVFEQDGKTYLRIGDKAIPFDGYDENGKPVIKPVITTVEHPDGRKDVTVHVPCLTIQPKQN